MDLVLRKWDTSVPLSRSEDCREPARLLEFGPCGCFLARGQMHRARECSDSRAFFSLRAAPMQRCVCWSNMAPPEMVVNIALVFRSQQYFGSVDGFTLGQMKLTDQIRDALRKLAPTQLHLHDLFKESGIDIAYSTVGKLISDDVTVDSDTLNKAFELLKEPAIEFKIKPVARRTPGRKPTQS